MTNKELDELRLKFITARLAGKVIQYRDRTSDKWVNCVISSSAPHVYPERCRIKPAEVVYVVMIVPSFTSPERGEHVDAIFKDLESATKYVESVQQPYREQLDIREIEINS